MATLSGDDASGHTGTADAAFTIAPLVVPLGSPVGARPALDGMCDDTVYAGGASLQLAPYADGSRGAVRVLRSDDHLWACFHGLVRGAGDVGSQVEVLLDANHSRDAQAQATDFLFAVAEDGSVLSRVGDGSGGFASPGPSGVAAQLGESPTGWTVEVRLDKARFGGWDHLAGLAFGHAVGGTTSSGTTFDTRATGDWFRTAIPTVRPSTISDACTGTLSSVALTRSVASGAPSQSTWASDAKFVPWTASVNVPEPAATLVGARRVTTGSSELTRNGTALDTVVPGAGTRAVTWTMPAVVSWAAVTVAVRWPVPPNVVANGAPFQRTKVPLMKPVPATPSANGAPPAVAAVGVSQWIAGRSPRLVVAQVDGWLRSAVWGQRC